MNTDELRQAVLDLLVLRPCHITGMHTPNHHTRSTCNDQKVAVLEGLLAALGIDLADARRELHPDGCWSCHDVPGQEKYRETRRNTYRWAGVPIPPELAAMAPDGLHPGDVQVVLQHIGVGWTPWLQVATEVIAETCWPGDRVHAAITALTDSGAVEHRPASGSTMIRTVDPGRADVEPQWTPDRLEAAFHAALSDGDGKGVDAALRVMATVDPKRAQQLFDMTKAALTIARSGG